MDIKMIGEKFNKLTILEKVESARGYIRYKCRCDCGNTKIANLCDLKKGTTKSCGCIRENDLTGKTYGKLKVIEKTLKRKNKSVVYRCICSCGTIVEYSGHILVSQDATNCGKCRGIDLTGQKKGIFIVTKDNKETLVCKCNCGNIFNIKRSLFYKRQSCGCLKRAILKKGERFGKLVVQEVNKYDKRATYWTCICDCGNLKIVKTVDLRSGVVKSCGCLKQKDIQEDTKWNHLYNRYKKGAKIRNLEFKLSFDDAKELFNKECYYCGTKYYNGSTEKGFKIKYNGIDRVDNSKGYIKENVVPCCGICNKAKGTMSSEIFQQWIGNIQSLKKGTNDGQDNGKQEDS
jgi:hypothetical protein